MECGSDLVSRHHNYNFNQDLLQPYDHQIMATDYPLRAMLVLAALLGSAFAYPERSRPRAADTLLQERRLCYYDDILLSFVHWSVDSVPICSSLLGIQDLTSTLPSATSRT